MIEIYHHKFSLFKLENFIYLGNDETVRFSERVFEYIDTFESLEKAKLAQKELKESSIILPSY
jgi:hypothetical protein